MCLIWNACREKKNSQLQKKNVQICYFKINKIYKEKCEKEGCSEKFTNERNESLSVPFPDFYAAEENKQIIGLECAKLDLTFECFNNWSKYGKGIAEKIPLYKLTNSVLLELHDAQKRLGLNISHLNDFIVSSFECPRKVSEKYLNIVISEIRNKKEAMRKSKQDILNNFSSCRVTIYDIPDEPIQTLSENDLLKKDIEYLSNVIQESVACIKKLTDENTELNLKLVQEYRTSLQHSSESSIREKEINNLKVDIQKKDSILDELQQN